MKWLIAVTALLSACSNNSSFIEVTVHSGTPLTIAALVLSVENAGQTGVVTVKHGASFMLPPDQTFSLSIDSNRRGDIKVTASARDNTGNELATASNSTTIIPGGVAPLTLILTPDVTDSSAPPDLVSLDLTTLDLATFDLATSDLQQVVTSFDVTPTMTSVQEHQLLSVHLTARHGDNTIATEYSGTPSLTSDWGDLKVINAPTFSLGQADATVWLNRETNSNNGLAHIKVVDGNAKGSSPGIAVSVPAWSATGNAIIAAGSAGSWDATLGPGYGIALKSNGAWFAAFTGSTSIGIATSTDGVLFTPQSMPILQPTGSGWESTQVEAESITADGNGLVLLYIGSNNLRDGMGIATSLDGLNWTRSVSNPISVVAAGGCGALNPGAFANLVVEGPNQYRLVFNDHASHTCTALSTDGGATWPAASIHVMSGFPNAVGPMALWKEGSVYKMYWYFAGFNYSTATDPTNWIASPSNPLTTGAQPMNMVWDDSHLHYVGIAQINSNSLGLATRP